MKALYRKYRPTKLSNVLAQDQVKKPLEEAIKSGKISHTYLFSGPRGCGKTSVARIFAHEVNNFDYEVEDNYVDIIEIDAASHTGVDNIRELIEKAMVAPTKGKYKVYIIDEIHMLSKSAFNALLKTLEEPPKSVIFIMATTDLHKVPDTIISRSQVYNFNLADQKLIEDYLAKIAKSEKISIDKEAISVIAKRGGGSFRDSISLLDQISTISSDKIKKEDVLQILGLPDDDMTNQLLNAYQSGDVQKITDLLHDQFNVGKKPEILAENLITKIIERPEPKLLPLLERLPDVKAPFPEAKLLMSFLAEAAERPVLRVFAEKQASSASKTAPKAETTDQPKPAHVPTDDIPFSWPDFLKKIKNPALSRTLDESEFKIENNKIYVQIKSRAHRNIVSSEKNQEIIRKHLPPNMELIVQDAAGEAQTQTKNEQSAENQNLGKISDIMGDVTEVNSDGNPF